jgi:hypothetical protein
MTGASLLSQGSEELEGQVRFYSLPRFPTPRRRRRFWSKFSSGFSPQEVNTLEFSPARYPMDEWTRCGFVKDFDVIDYGPPCLIAIPKVVSVEQLALERGEEALSHSVVVAVANRSGRGNCSLFQRRRTLDGQ